MQRNIILEGKFVRLEEIYPKYFSKVVEWRNNPENNKFLNQPFKLTMELEKKWYEEKYLNDMTQGLFIVIDKKNNEPFATIGYTDYDWQNKICITGRLLVGESEYKGSKAWQEGVMLFNNHIYNELDINKMYAYIIKENIASIKWHKKWGYTKSFTEFYFPNELYVNGMEQEEYYRTRGSYNKFLINNNILGTEA